MFPTASIVRIETQSIRKIGKKSFPVLGIVPIRFEFYFCLIWRCWWKGNLKWKQKSLTWRLFGQFRERVLQHGFDGASISTQYTTPLLYISSSECCVCCMSGCDTGCLLLYLICNNPRCHSFPIGFDQRIELHLFREFKEVTSSIVDVSPMTPFLSIGLLLGFLYFQIGYAIHYHFLHIASIHIQ